MNCYPFFLRGISALLLLSLILGFSGPISFTPNADAAPSSQKRQIRKLKNQNRKLKRNNGRLGRELAAALAAQSKRIAVQSKLGMVMIPAGNFQMGRQSGSGLSDELPAHTVAVGAFYMDRFEVTKDLWDKVRTWAANNGYSDIQAGEGQGSFHPVHSVSWYDMVKWCNARSEMEGLTPVYYTSANHTFAYKTGEIDLPNTHAKWTANGYRLPTEAEWEKAARGTLVGNTYPWGNSFGGSDANYLSSGDPFDVATPDETTPVGFYDGGQIPAGVDRGNGYGLYDVAGNVWEWCWDRYDSSWYSNTGATVTDTRGPTTTGVTAPSGDHHRVMRGGSWLGQADTIRCADRYRNDPTVPRHNVGFRTVCLP